MAEDTTTTEEVVAETTATESAGDTKLDEVATETQPSTESVTDEVGEPGGDSPTAIYARKQYREAKRLREEKSALELERERLRGEIDALKAKPEPKDTLTIEQVIQAAREGKVDPYLAQQFISRETTKQLLAAERETAKAQEPIRKAEAELQDYIEEIPDLQDRGSKAFRAVAQKFNELRSFGYADNAATQRVAVELAHGSLDRIRAKSASDRLTRETLRPHNEAPGGGSATPKPNDIANAPAGLKAMWEKTGTSQVDRAKEWKHYLARTPTPRTPRA